MEALDRAFDAIEQSLLPYVVIVFDGTKAQVVRSFRSLRPPRSSRSRRERKLNMGKSGLDSDAIVRKGGDVDPEFGQIIPEILP